MTTIFSLQKSILPSILNCIRHRVILLISVTRHNIRNIPFDKQRFNL